jgi:hypothetical protein
MATRSPIVEIYLNSDAPTKAKNLSVSTLCRNLLDGHFCNAAISVDSRLCAACRKRGHAKLCGSPQQECSCGYSRLFWAEVEVWAEAKKFEIEKGIIFG